MKVLALTIKQQPFNEILTGEKTEEFRELRPTMYCSRLFIVAMMVRYIKWHRSCLKVSIVSLR